MKKLLTGVALGTAASLAIRDLAGHGRKLHEHCGEMMRTGCHDSHADGTRQPPGARGRAPDDDDDDQATIR